MTDEVALQRMIHLAEEAEQYEAELLATAARIKLYREANGVAPATGVLLEAWAREHVADPLDPYEVLTKEEIVQVWEDAEDPRRQSC